MPAGWAAAGAAVLGAATAYAGSKKQSDAAKRGSNVQLQMFDTLNRQQQPFIQSGYGAMGKLNTLLGLGGRGGGGMPLGGNATLMPRQPPQVNNGPGGPGVRLPPRLLPGPQTQGMPGGGMPQNLRLRQLLALRAANGDTEAERMMELV